MATTSKDKKKQQNSRNSDWLSRKLFNKIEQIAPMHGKKLIGVKPFFTSHQDPFEHNKKEDKICMKARFDYLDVGDLKEWHMSKISAYLKNNDPAKVGSYYNKSILQFFDHYCINHLSDDLKKKKVKLADLQRRLMDTRFEKVLFPKQGGRYYLATHKLATNAIPFVFNRQTFYLSNADHIAAINIGLTYLGH